MHPIKIYPHKFRNIAFLILGITFSASSHYLSDNDLLVSASPLTSQILLYFCLPFFVFASFYELFSLVFGRSGITVSDEGIEDNSTIIKYGLISWAEIDRIFYQRVSNKEYFCVALKKPETFLKKQSFFKKLFSKNKHKDSSFVTIPQSTLPIKPGNFIKEIRKAHPEIRVHYPFPQLEDMVLNPNSHLDPK